MRVAHLRYSSVVANLGLRCGIRQQRLYTLRMVRADLEISMEEVTEEAPLPQATRQHFSNVVIPTARISLIIL